jgi:GrpB-like predicted nucleotidyltransferase (UPF0157 family)
MTGEESKQFLEELEEIYEENHPYDRLIYEEIHQTEKKRYTDWLKEHPKLYEDYLRWRRWLSSGRI